MDGGPVSNGPVNEPRREVYRGTQWSCHNRPIAIKIVMPCAIEQDLSSWIHVDGEDDDKRLPGYNEPSYTIPLPLLVGVDSVNGAVCSDDAFLLPTNGKNKM
ncbi:hypothetical protein Droror1_Dr00010252 [Drosera rotundifolia]